MDLFSQITNSFEPLAEKLRPVKMDDLVGQSDLFQEGSWLLNALKKDLLPSLILWGPPGTGKTTFAKIISNLTKKNFISLNAISTGAKEIRELGEKAKNQNQLYNQGTILFIDEIHRLNKSQQDVLLPFVESGFLTLIGATTENPSFEVNSALLSRSRVIVFKKHNDQSLQKILDKALSYYKLQLSGVLDDEAKNRLFKISDGDGRFLLNRLEEIFTHYFHSNKKSFPLNVDSLNTILGSRTFYYDKMGENHYDTISAFIKSIRGSDVDASIYYLARMLQGGEDPLFIARRLIILASEDIGNADPRALQIAMSGFEAAKIVGMPECRINLAQVVIYLASAPKSNSAYVAIESAIKEVENSSQLPIPNEIRNAPTELMKNLGYSKDYKYAHLSDKGWVKMDFLPSEIKDKKFYETKEIGFEKKMKEYLDWLKK